MIFIRKNGQIVRADGKDLREVVVIVSASSSSQVITGKNVPVLTEAQFIQAYNNVVDGKVVYVASENDEIFVIKQVNEESGNPVIYFDYYNSHILRYELAESEVEITAKEYGGVGAVVSVNGKAGVVVLDATDIKLTTNQQTVQQNFIRVDESIEDLYEEATTAIEIAEGKTKSYVIDEKDDITGTETVDGEITNVTAIAGISDLSVLKVGDIINVKELNTPDYWVSQIAPSITLSKMETSKVDLENYYKKSETDALLNNKQNKVVIVSTSNITIGGLSVPSLTVAQIQNAYNNIVAGNTVVVTSNDGAKHFIPTLADDLSDMTAIHFTYYNLVITYWTENNTVYNEYFEIENEYATDNEVKAVFGLGE